MTSSEQEWKYHSLLCEGDSENSNANHSSRLKKAESKTGIYKEGTEMSHNNSATKLLWTDETKINLYQSDGKVKVWRTKGSAHTYRLV